MRIGLIAALFVVLIASPCMARTTSTTLLEFPTPIIVNGALVPSGIYRLTWETHATSVNIAIWKGATFMAGGEGAWVKEGTRFPGNAILLRVNSDGSRSLAEIRLAGFNKSIVLTDHILRVPPQSAGHLLFSIH